MASYEVVLKPAIQKDLRALPKAVAKRIWNRIKTLANNPQPRQSVKLTGAERLYRVRVGDYQIVYGVDMEQMIVTVHYVRHRSKAYRD